MCTKPEALTLQDIWNDINENENIYIVGAAKNVNGLDTLYEFSSQHNFTFPLSSKDQLGKAHSLFDADFVAISKNGAVTGKLDKNADENKLRKFIDLAIEVMNGGLYLTGSFNNQMLNQDEMTFQLSDIIGGGDDSEIEYSLEYNSDPLSVIAEINDDKLVVKKGSKFGLSEISFTAMTSEKNEIEYKFNIINPLQYLNADFETNSEFSSEWNTEGDQNWFIDDEFSFSGGFSARSGAIDNSQATELTREMDVPENSNISFSYKVSSEPQYDTFNFLIDGEVILTESGEKDWTTVSFPVSAGNHIFKWIFQKDNVVSAGLNSAFLDAVIFPVKKTNSIVEEINTVESLILNQNYPNPFNPNTTIKFFNKNAGVVKLSVFNIKGELIQDLVNKNMKAGNHSINFNAYNLNSGVYYYTLQTTEKSITKKMIMIK